MFWSIVICSRYVEALGGAERYLMLEFVKGDLPEQFLADAETLKGWLKK